jgi:hypothetical protein
VWPLGESTFISGMDSLGNCAGLQLGGNLLVTRGETTRFKFAKLVFCDVDAALPRGRHLVKVSSFPMMTRTYDLARTFYWHVHFCFDLGCMELAASMNAPRAKMGIGLNPVGEILGLDRRLQRWSIKRPRQGFAPSLTSLC